MMKMLEKTQIVELAHAMQDKSDLLQLLNNIKSDEAGRIGGVEDQYPFTMRQLNRYCNPNIRKGRFREFAIKKKSGKDRQITAPRTKTYMCMLRCVNRLFQAIYTPSAYAMGFSEGKSIADNASVHKGQNYVLNIDLKDFFPSIDQARVWKRLQLAPFNFPQEIASVLAGLCSMKLADNADGLEKIRYVLPQGSPASPIITNMVCDTLDRRLGGLAKRFGLNYSRYADDITFSSMHNVYQPEGEFLQELERIVTGQRFTINPDKTRLQKLGARQEVTGIIVSHKINVTGAYVSDLRNILYIWERYGYKVAYGKFLSHYSEKKVCDKKGLPDMINVIEGKLCYMQMVKGAEDSTYRKLYERFSRLAERKNATIRTNRNNITVINDWKALDFEGAFGSPIVLEENPSGENIKAYFMLGEKRNDLVVKHGVTLDLSEKKENLKVAQCKDAKGEMFLLLHRADKPIVFRPNQVNIDKLISVLDELIKL